MITDDGEPVEEFITKLKNCMDNGGSYCLECGIYFKTVIDGRKHDFQKHYDYALYQCYGDKEKLMEWMNLGK